MSMDKTARGKTAFLVLALLALILTAISLRHVRGDYVIDATCNSSNTPVLDTIPDLEGDEGRVLYYDMNATDPNNNSITYIIYMQLNRTFNLAWNNVTGVINYTPHQVDVGNYRVIVEARNNISCSGVQTFISLVVYDKPNISAYVPASPNPSGRENASIFFNITVDDNDVNETLRYVWLMNSTPVSTNSSYDLLLNFSMRGTYNITVIVNDTRNLTDIHSWNLTVNNTNRVPVWNIPLANIIWQEDINLINNFSLSDKYYDDDFDDSHTFRVVGNNYINVSITSYGNVTLIPRANWSGTEIVYFIVNDSYDTALSNNVALNVTQVNDPPVLTRVANQVLYAYAPYSLLLNVSDPDNATFIFYSDNSLFNITNAGLIALVPNQSDSGNHSVYINVSDGIDTDAIVVNFTVNNNSRPVFSTSNLTAQEGTYFEYIALASDPDDNPINFSSNYSQFSMSQINSTAAIFSFTPIIGNRGNFSVVVIANDSRGAENRSTFYLFVTGLNHAPYFGSFNQKNATVNRSFSTTISATDPDGDTLTYRDNATFFNIQPNGVIQFVANTSDEGTYTIGINASDGQVTNKTSVVFKIISNKAPVFSETITFMNCSKGSVCTSQLNASDENRDSFTFYYSTNLSSFYMSSAGRVNFTPANSDVINNNATSYNVTLGVIEVGTPEAAKLSTEMNIVVTVLAQNLPPVLNPVGNKTTTQGNATVFYVVGSDPENDNLTFADNTTLFDIRKLNETTAIVNFTATNTDVGNHSINLSVSDGQSVASEVIWIVILNANDAPNVTIFWPNATNVSMVENFTLFFNQSSTDPDLAYGDAVSYSWKIDGIEQSTNSSWTYAPNFTAAGLHNVSFIVRDLIGLNATLKWNVTVNNTNRRPYLLQNISNVNLTRNTLLMPWITLTSYLYDPDTNDILNYTLNGTSDISLGYDSSYIALLLSPSWTGSVNVTIIVNDSFETAVSNYFTITVAQLQQQPTPSSGGGGGGGGGGVGSRIIEKNVTVEVKTPQALRIIVPKPMSLFENDTIVAPIQVINNFNKTLNEVLLSAGTKMQGVKLAFSNNYFESIEPGAARKVDLVISSYRASSFGTFEIEITANVSSPSFQDSAILYLNALEKGSENESAVKLRIAYAEDLVSSNSLCLELKESLEKANELLKRGNTKDASVLVDDTIKACKYLKETIEQANNKNNEKPMKIKFSRTTFLWIGLIVALAGAVLVFLFKGRARKRSRPMT